MQYFLNAFVVLLIVITIWFFLMKSESKTVKVEKKIQVIVDGGYQPDNLEIPVGETTTLEFLRKDPTSCLEEVIFPDFKIKQYLPMNAPTEIQLTPTQKGVFQFHCGMSMFFGKLRVV